jgi:5,10-methenyltetrahydrofolate synthetase
LVSRQQPPVPSSSADPRLALRQQLLARRKTWFASAEAAQQRENIARHLATVLRELEPECLGLYWPFDCEFNAVELWQTEQSLHGSVVALPYAYKSPKRMEFRQWDGKPPELRDECGILAASGAVVVPDVVLVPCLGFTRQAYRLGYGGGYFDRWLAQHPETVAIGLAWAGGEIEFEIAPHDVPMTLVITEQGVVG